MNITQINLTPINYKYQNNKVNPAYVSPSFRMATKNTAKILSILSAAAAAYGQALITANKNDKTEEIPTKDEFIQMVINNEEIANTKLAANWISSFKTNPEKTWTFYNMHNDGGQSFVSQSFLRELHPYQTEDIAEGLENPDIVLTIANLKDKNGARLYDFDQAMRYAKWVVKYPNGCAKMFSITDEIGNPRFGLNYEKLAEVFEKYPETATKLAKELDEFGHYKYGDSDIYDKIMHPEMKRESYKKSHKNDKTKEHPIYNIKTPDGYYVADIVGKLPEGLIDAYEKMPEETTKLIQMSHLNVPSDIRFYIPEIDIDTTRFYKYAQKTFMSLCRLRSDISFTSVHNFEFLRLEDIKDIMKEFCINENGSVHEADPQTLKKIIEALREIDRINPYQYHYFSIEELKYVMENGSESLDNRSSERAIKRRG